MIKTGRFQCRFNRVGEQGGYESPENVHRPPESHNSYGQCSTFTSIYRSQILCPYYNMFVL